MSNAKSSITVRKVRFFNKLKEKQLKLQFSSVTLNIVILITNYATRLGMNYSKVNYNANLTGYLIFSLKWAEETEELSRLIDYIHSF